MKVNIFGSCYSRELFNYQTKNEVNCYVMNQSIFTLYSKPLRITFDQAASTDGSNFKKRMMYYEFNKIGLKSLLGAKSDILVIDFADCRYDIYEFDSPKGVKIIYTHESRATFDNITNIRKFENIKKHYCNIVETFDTKKIEAILKRFCKEILTIYTPDQVVLNKIQMNNKYFESGEEKTLINNFHYSRFDFIKKIEQIFLQIMPNCKVLYSQSEPVLNINHRFGGPHPLHFEDIYYNYRMNLLDCLINNKSTTSAQAEYNKTYKKQIHIIQQKSNDESLNAKNSSRVDL